MAWNTILTLPLLFCACFAIRDPIESDSENFSVTSMNVYFFNWTNPEDIRNSSVKPKFEEIGPYKYKIVQQTINNTHAIDKFYFDEENSLSESDIINTFNLVPWLLTNSAKDYYYMTKLSLDIVLRTINCGIYLQKTIRELMFEGYNEPLLDVLRDVNELSPQLEHRFGWFYKKNGTISPINDCYLTDPKEHSKTVLYSDTENTTYDFQEISKSDTILFHIPYISSPLTLVVANKENSTYKYEAAAFAPKYDEKLSVYASLPHFLSTNPSYTEAIEGLQPNEALHGTYIKFDTESGDFLESKVRLQANVLLQPDDTFSLYENVTEIMLPIFWTEVILF